MRKRPRVVIDTNVFVSGLINARGESARLLLAQEQRQFQLVTAPPLMSEVGQVLRRPYLRAKHGLSDSDVSTILLRVLNSAEVATPLTPLPLTSRDPKDDIFLAVALGAQADYLVTSDDDLLSLRGHTGLGQLRIVTVQEMISLLTP